MISQPVRRAVIWTTGIGVVDVLFAWMQHVPINPNLLGLSVGCLLLVFPIFNKHTPHRLAALGAMLGLLHGGIDGVAGVRLGLWRGNLLTIVIELMAYSALSVGVCAWAMQRVARRRRGRARQPNEPAA